MKKDPYVKMSIVISIEIYILVIINLLLGVIIENFNSLYLIIAEISLLILQFVDVLLQKQEYKKDLDELCRRNKQ